MVILQTMVATPLIVDVRGLGEFNKTRGKRGQHGQTDY